MTVALAPQIFSLQDGNCKCREDLINYYPQIPNSYNLVFVFQWADRNSLYGFYNLS